MTITILAKSSYVLLDFIFNENFAIFAKIFRETLGNIIKLRNLLFGRVAPKLASFSKIYANSNGRQ